MSPFIPLIFLGTILSISFRTIAGFWNTFKKASQPGWGCIIPIYSFYLLTKIARQSPWLTLAVFIPFVNMFVLLYVFNGVAKNFGKGVGFTAGLFFLGFIFWPMLGFGSASYKTPKEPTPSPGLMAA